MSFSKSAKNNIDFYVPLLGTGVAFYYMYRSKNFSLEKLLAYTAITWLLLYILVSKTTGSIYKRSSLQEDVPLPNPSGEYSSLMGFDAANYSKRLHDDIDGIRWGQMVGGSTDIALYKDMELMSQNQLVLVANQYKNDWGESLISAMQNETYPNMLGDGTADRVDSIIRRLQSLGIR